jgi:phenylacetate-coenzyme A ligase PaaK-like adenylate-forming protein
MVVGVSAGQHPVRVLSDIVRAGRGTPSGLESRQQERLHRLVAFARERSVFYGKLYAGLPSVVRDPRVLPPVSKRDLMANFDGWATDDAVRRETADAFVADTSRIGRYYLDRYLAFSTSGTTGRPAVFLHDRGAVTVYIALMIARRLPTLLAAGSLRSFLRNRGRTATIITTGGHFSSSVVEALARSRFPRLSGRNRTFSLLDPLPDVVRALNGFQPAVLGSYPTALAVLAGEQAAGRLRIRPALALSGAERLSPAAAERIRASFLCPLRDTYAASEFMGIAFDCRYGNLHLNADWVILEPVDAALRPVPPGTPSHSTLLTNLSNRVQPVIRYDLGDSVTMLPGPCPCGSPLPLVRPEGRRDEILYLESPGGGEKPVLPLVLATVVEETAGILGYQVIRAGPGRLRVRVDEAPGFDRLRVCDDLLRRLREYLSSMDLGSVLVELAGERPVRDPSGGKLRQFYAER